MESCSGIFYPATAGCQHSKAAWWTSSPSPGIIAAVKGGVYMDLGSTISRLRAARRMSQGDLAEAPGGLPAVRLQVGDQRQCTGSGQAGEAEPPLRRHPGPAGDGEQSAASPESEPVPAAAAPPSPPLRSRQRLAAIILLCMAFLVWLLLTALGGFLEGLILALPFLICAGICFAARRRAGLWCAWTVYLTVELYIRWAPASPGP